MARSCRNSAQGGQHSRCRIRVGQTGDQEFTAGRFFAIDLREAGCCCRIVEIQDNATARVKTAEARDTGAAKAAGTVVENRQVRHVRALTGASHLI